MIWSCNSCRRNSERDIGESRQRDCSGHARVRRDGESARGDHVVPRR